MSNITAQLVCPAQATLGEGPVWIARENSVFWIDINGRNLYQYKVDEKTNCLVGHFDQTIGCLAECADHSLLVALKDKIYKYHPDTNTLVLLNDSLDVPADNRFNDGKCDPFGNFIVGTLNLNGQDGASALYAIDAQGKAKTLLEGVNLSNGMAWSLAGDIFYYIDTPTKCVRAYRYDAQRLSLSNPEVVVRFADNDGWPDGMTIDDEGMLWIAHWDGACVSRWNPTNGNRIQEVKLPCANVTSACFGDTDLKTLYITTAREGLTENQLAAQPQSGGLFSVRLNVAGRLMNSYKG